MSFREAEVYVASPFLADQAARVLSHVTPNEDGSREVGILVILAILGAIIQVYECLKENPRALEEVHRVGLINALKLRRTIKMVLGTDLNRRKGEEIIAGLYAIGQQATSVDLATFLEEMEKPAIKLALANL
jgi:hypothetical protein